MSNAERQQLTDANERCARLERDVERLDRNYREATRAINDNNAIIHNLNVEKQNLTSAADSAKKKADLLGARVLDLETSLSDTKSELTGATKMVESLQKELAAERAENTDLRENLQRTLGYIDRVNEDSPPAQPAVIMPERAEPQQRGPRFTPLGHRFYTNGEERSMGLAGATQSIHRRY